LKQDGTYFAYGIALRMWNVWSKFSKEAAGSFLFCRREAFEEIGGFSANLFAAEEIDFCRRLKKFGKSRQQHLRILSAHPLITSARKASLYKPREFFSFMVKTILQGGKTLKRREDCPIWYDGRR
jgi:hypothetical protein